MIQDLGIEITPLRKQLIIIEASRGEVNSLGTAKIFIESDVLGSRKMIEIDTLWQTFQR